MIGRLLLVAALAVTALVMLGATSSPATACSCVAASTAGHAARADAVFTGQITETRGGGRDLTTSVEYDVEVTEVYKGDVPATTTVSTGAHAASCGMPGLPQDTALLFFASAADGRVSVTSCGGTAAADRALVAGVTAALGEPEPPGDEAGGKQGGEPSDADTNPAADGSAESGESRGSEDDTDNGRPVAWVLAGGLLLLGLAAGFAALRKRGSNSESP